jgi:hypothetical protein
MAAALLLAPGCCSGRGGLGHAQTGAKTTPLLTLVRVVAARGGLLRRCAANNQQQVWSLPLLPLPQYCGCHPMGRTAKRTSSVAATAATAATVGLRRSGRLSGGGASAVAAAAAPKPQPSAPRRGTRGQTAAAARQQAPHQQQRRRLASGTLSKNSAVAPKVPRGRQDTQPARAAAKKIKKTPKRKKAKPPPPQIDPPPGWRSTWDLICELRADRTAVVDSMGSEALAAVRVSPVAR